MRLSQRRNDFGPPLPPGRKKAPRHFIDMCLQDQRSDVAGSMHREQSCDRKDRFKCKSRSCPTRSCAPALERCADSARVALCWFGRLRMYVLDGASEPVLREAVVKHKPVDSAFRQCFIGVEIIAEDDAYIIGVRGCQINHRQYRLRLIACPFKRDGDGIWTLNDYTFHLRFLLCHRESPVDELYVPRRMIGGFTGSILNRQPARSTTWLTSSLTSRASRPRIFVKQDLLPN